MCNKETIITTSSNILSERTLNLKKEIVNLDEEIIQLQHSLHNAIASRGPKSAKECGQISARQVMTQR